MTFFLLCHLKGIRWADVRYDNTGNSVHHLLKPLHSGLAARLYIYLKYETKVRHFLILISVVQIQRQETKNNFSVKGITVRLKFPSCNKNTENLFNDI